MPLADRLKREFRAVLVTTAFFGVWIGTLYVIKQLLLAEYHASTYNVGAALFGVLLLAKVVVVLERVPLGSWVARRGAWVDVLLRTGMYAAGVLAVLIVERGLSGMREHGGFLAGVDAAFRKKGAHHVGANVVSIAGGLLVYNAIAVIRRNLGDGAMFRMLLSPLPQEPGRIAGAPG